MRHFWTFLLILCGCGGGKQESVSAESERKHSLPAAQEISLSTEAQKRAGIEVRAAEARSISETRRATGRITVNENRSWRVGAITEGRIVHVLSNVGDIVEGSQILARMHSHDIHEARALYQQAKGELARLQSAEAFARRSRDRARRLFDMKAASLESVDLAESVLRNAESGVAHGQTEVERTRRHLVEFLGVPADEPPHHKDGEHGDEDLIPIRSPARGTVLQRDVTAGTVVTPATGLFQISDLSTVWMMAAVPEDALARLRAGMPVRVSVQAYAGRVFTGRIGRIGDQLDAATRTVQVRVELANPNGLLKPEMYATAELGLGATAVAVFVPETAIQEIDGRPAVFVRESAERFKAQLVERGETVDGFVRISSGLRPSELIATSGAFVLKSQLMKGSLSDE